MTRRIFYRLLAWVSACIVTPWALYHQKKIHSYGRKLTDQEMAIAARLGLVDIEQTFVMEVSIVPNPLRWSFELLEKCGSACIYHVDGITLGHAIYLARGAAGSIELMAHELVHVRQYERAGSVRAFMIEYIDQCLSEGYHDAPWEIEARVESAQALVEGQ